MSSFFLFIVCFITQQRHSPPELVLALQTIAHPAQDVFTLGLLFFEVLCGSPLFVSDTEALQAYRQTQALSECNTPAPFQSKQAAIHFIDRYVRARLNALQVYKMGHDIYDVFNYCVLIFF